MCLVDGGVIQFYLPFHIKRLDPVLISFFMTEHRRENLPLKQRLDILKWVVKERRPVDHSIWLTIFLVDWQEMSKWEPKPITSKRRFRLLWVSVRQLV